MTLVQTSDSTDFRHSANTSKATARKCGRKKLHEVHTQNHSSAAVASQTGRAVIRQSPPAQEVNHGEEPASRGQRGVDDMARSGSPRCACGCMGLEGRGGASLGQRGVDGTACWVTTLCLWLHGTGGAGGGGGGTS